MYKSRREALAAKLPENAIAFLFSGKEVHSIGDEMFPFKVDRNFYYLTGIDRPNMVYMLVKLNGVATDTLFIESFDAMMAKWVGAKMLPAEATEISGIQNVMMIEKMWGCIQTTMCRQMDHEENVAVYVDLAKQNSDQVLPAHAFANEFTVKYPHAIVKNLFSKMVDLRVIKSDEEVEIMKKAIDVTYAGIKNMMDHSHGDIWENELEAHFDFVLKCNQCDHAFPTIIGSGKNGTVLHYGENNQVAKDGSLVLCDLGAAYKNYSADITRTFPINGKFTERQKQIYNIVLEANEMIIAAVKPGLTLRGLNAMVIEFYEKKLAEIGLLENGKKVSDYYWHGVSHMLGLETHDVQLSGYELQAGNVFTVEPGLYLEEEGIGIRIEDDVLVTEDGCINLSKDIIKSVEDIEAYMAK